MTTTLLAVDDSNTMRKVLEITFSGGDFRAVLAQSADDALAKAQAERPTVALIDAGLEGTNGYDLCQKIKSAAPGVAVILLSSKQQPFDRARGAAVGADDFMDKPFDTQQMIDKVVAVARKGASSPIAAPAPAPVAQAPVPAAARPAERPRVQTLAYGTAHIPNIPAAPAPAAPKVSAVPRAPAPAPVTPQPAEVAPRPVAPAIPSAAAQGNGRAADFAQKLGGLGLTAAQIEGVLALSREVVEKVVWEVVPTLAETIIKEEIQRLTSE